MRLELINFPTLSVPLESFSSDLPYSNLRKDYFRRCRLVSIALSTIEVGESSYKILDSYTFYEDPIREGLELGSLKLIEEENIE